MGTLKRIVSGSIVVWLQMLVGILGQILVVPVFLTRWDASVYGVWLALQAFVGLLALLSVSFQTYVQGELLKIGKHDTHSSRQLFWSALPVAWLLSFLEVLAVLFVFAFVDMEQILGAKGGINAIVDESTLLWILLAYGLMNIVFMPFGGLAVRLLTVYGHFARVSLWGVVRLATTLIVSATAVYAGFSFLFVGLLWVATHAITAAAGLIDMIYLMNRDRILGFLKPQLIIGFKALWRSQALSLSNIFNMISGNGVRLILSTALGGTAVATFSTNRTLSNVMKQGIGSITQPLLPELMDALNCKNQNKTEGVFSLVWLVALIVLVPSFTFMQLLIPPVFEFWTRGKIAYDPLLFALFSGSILVYVLSQSARAVVAGNNLLKIQLMMSVVSGAVAIVALFWATKYWNLYGAAFALFLSELTLLLGFTYGAKDWMHRVGLRWPSKLQRLAAMGCFVCVITLVVNSLVELQIALTLAVLSTASAFILALLYLRSLPSPILGQIIQLVNNCSSRFLPRRT